MRLVEGSGAPGRNRTSDAGIFSPSLYQLSYQGTPAKPAEYSTPPRAESTRMHRARAPAAAMRGGSYSVTLAASLSMLRAMTSRWIWFVPS